MLSTLLYLYTLDRTTPTIENLRVLLLVSIFGRIMPTLLYSNT